MAEPTPSPLKQIRTFEGDMAEAIARGKESLVSIQQAEVARRDAIKVLGPKPIEPESRRGLIYTTLAVVLLALGGAGVWYSYSTYTEKTALPVVVLPENQFIPAESLTNVNASTLSRDALILTVTNARAKTHGAAETEQLQFLRGSGADSELLTTSDFLVRLNAHASSELVRGLGPLFMFGLTGTPTHSFMLVQVSSFQLAFPGMLDWEAGLASDILPLFASQAVAENIPTGAGWSDVTIGNRDARILKDPNNNTVLLYAFFDTDYLIITDTEETFRTIVNRLQSQKLSR